MKYIVLLFLVGCGVRAEVEKPKKPNECQSVIHTDLAWSRYGGHCWFHIIRNRDGCTRLDEEEYKRLGGHSCELNGLTCDKVMLTASSSCQVEVSSGICYFDTPSTEI